MEEGPECDALVFGALGAALVVDDRVLRRCKRPRRSIPNELRPVSSFSSIARQYRTLARDFQRDRQGRDQPALHELPSGGRHPTPGQRPARTHAAGLRAATAAPASPASPARPATPKRISRWSAPARPTRAFRATRAGASRRSNLPGRANRSDRSASRSRTRTATADARSRCCRSISPRRSGRVGLGAGRRPRASAGHAGAARRTGAGLDRYQARPARN